jgi:hypothetical protein
MTLGQIVAVTLTTLILRSPVLCAQDAQSRQASRNVRTAAVIALNPGPDPLSDSVAKSLVKALRRRAAPPVLYLVSEHNVDVSMDPEFPHAWHKKSARDYESFGQLLGVDVLANVLALRKGSSVEVSTVLYHPRRLRQDAADIARPSTPPRKSGKRRVRTTEEAGDRLASDVLSDPVLRR